MTGKIASHDLEEAKGPPPPIYVFVVIQPHIILSNKRTSDLDGGAGAGLSVQSQAPGAMVIQRLEQQ